MLGIYAPELALYSADLAPYLSNAQ